MPQVRGVRARAQPARVGHAELENLREAPLLNFQIVEQQLG
jgi:hypothetical protein